MTLQQRGRLDNIQALRFVAAALVLLTHITFYANARVDPAFAVWSPGAAGVSLFFVISGVVIYLSSRTLPPGAPSAAIFMRRRVLRIFPLYWLITTLKVILVLALPAALIKNQASLGYVIESYLLVPVLNPEGQMEPIHGVGWSLIHEMYFYYVFAAGMLLRLSPVAFSSVVIAVLCFMGIFFEADSALLKVCFSEQNLLFVTGMLLARAYDKGVRLPAPVAGATVALGLVAMLYEPARALWFPVLHRFDIGAVLIMAGAMSAQLPAAQRLQRLMVWLGDGSYSVYLIHPLLAPALIVLLAKLGGMPLPLAVAITWAACIVTGQLAFLYLETPLNGKVRGMLEWHKAPQAPRADDMPSAPACAVVEEPPVVRRRKV